MTCQSPPITAVHFLINGISFPTLHGNVQSGDQVSAVFSVLPGCLVTARLYSFYEATPTYGDPQTNQVLFQKAIRVVTAGADQTLGPVGIPPCNFQTDFNFVSHGVVTPVSHDTGGGSSCASPSASASCNNTGAAPTIDVSLANGGPGSDTFTVRQSSRPTFSDTVTLRAGQSVHRSYPFGNVATDLISVMDNQVPQFKKTFSLAFCGAPSVSEQSACGGGAPTATFTATNPTPAGGASDTISIARGGATVLTLVVPAASTETGSVTYPLNQAPIFTATGPFGLSRQFQAKQFTTCANQTTTTTAPSTTSTTLPPSNGGGGQPPTLAAASGAPSSVPASAAPASPSNIPSSPSGLAFTGFHTQVFLIWALLFLGAGFGLVLVSTRIPRLPRQGNDRDRP